MNFTLLGWNFRSTPLEIRDRLSLTEQEQLELVQQINARCGIQESVLLSTCNRTELYLYNMERPAEELLEVLQKRWGCLLYTSPSPRDLSTSRMPSSA